MKKISLLLVITLLLMTMSTWAQEECEANITSPNAVEIYMFYGQGCPHCAKMEEWFSTIKDQYPTLTIFKKEVYQNSENRKLFKDMSAAYGKELGGVPTVFIDDKVIVGFSNSIGTQIEQEIKRCVKEECISPYKVVTNETVIISGDSSPIDDPAKTDAAKTLTIPMVIGAAAVDAINPCEFAVLILLMTTILATGHRKRALFAGLAFTLSIFISYYLMGFGLFSAIQASGLTHLFYIIVSILAILVGIFNLKDYLWYGRWFKMEVPDSWRPRMKQLIKSVTSVPGAFLIGFVVSLFLLPCTSGPYIVILGLLASQVTRNHAMFLLLLYNLIFILPMLIITFAISFGFTTTEQAEHWRQKKLKVLHLITGAVILLIGLAMLGALALGMV